MEESQEIRRSGRRRVRPVEFWNFEKPEESVSKSIIYNELELTKHSIFKTFSLSYHRTLQRSSTSVKEKLKSPDTAAKREKGPSALSSKNSTCSLKSRGRKRKLESAESPKKGGAHSVVNGEDPLSSPWLRRRKRRVIGQEPPGKDGAHSVSSGEDPLSSPRLRRRKGRVVGQEPPGKSRAHSVSNGEDPLCSLRVAGKKQKLVGKERSGDEGYSTLSEDPICSSKIRQRLKPESKEFQKQKVESTSTLNGEDPTRWAAREETHEYNNNREENASLMLSSKNKSNLHGSLFSDSNGQHTKSTYMRKLNLSGTQNSTTFEQPSFRNIFSSTVIEAPGKAVFKVPRLPTLRRPTLPMLKVSSHCLDPSMVTIPEEREEQQQQQEEEKKKAKEKQQEDKEQRQQQHKENWRGEQEEKEEEEQVELEKVPQQSEEEHGDGGATATTSTRGPKTRSRSEKIPSARVATEPEIHEQDKGQRGQEDTLTQAALNPRRSSRVRMKPLEFWNFEKVEVERREDGEMQVIHQKQDSNQHIQTRVVDCSAALGSQPGQGITLFDDLLRDTTEALTQRSKVRKSTVTSRVKGRPRISPKKSLRTGNKDGVYPALSPSQGKRKVAAQNLISSWSPNRTVSKSPIKRKLFSPSDNFYKEPVEEEPRVTKISVGGKRVTVVGRVKFSDLQFVVLEKKDYRCYVGHGLHDKDKNIFITYLFLERGQIVWNTSRMLTVFVMEGCGVLKIVKDHDGKSYPLKAKVTVQCQKASKLSLKKDGRCKMLKLHLCWANATNDGCR